MFHNLATKLGGKIKIEEDNIPDVEAFLGNQKYS